MIIVIEEKKLIIGVVGFAAIIIAMYLLIPGTVRNYQNAKSFAIIENRAAERVEEYIAKLEELRLSQLKDAQVGDSIYYGFYEQDNNLMNGKEEIEWDVLARDGDKILIISKYILDAKPYHENNDPVTWEESSMRAWLNGEFANEAFSYRLQEGIVPVTLVHMDNIKHVYTNVGKSEKEEIFLLSEYEAVMYYNAVNRERAESRRCFATAYAIAQGVVVDTNRICAREYVFWREGEERIEPEYGQSIWWLRSIGDASRVVVHTGRLVGDGIELNVTEFGVRPAMWITTEK